VTAYCYATQKRNTICNALTTLFISHATLRLFVTRRYLLGRESAIYILLTAHFKYDFNVIKYKMPKLKPWTLHNKMITSTIIKSTKLKQHVYCRFDNSNYFSSTRHVRRYKFSIAIKPVRSVVSITTRNYEQCSTQVVDDKIVHIIVSTSTDNKTVISKH